MKDELIQKDPTLWQKAVEKSVPAVDWLLQKYESNLNLNSVPDKRKYSDVALKLLSYIQDEVERASYETKVAHKLGVEVDVLREKGHRLNQKLAQSSKKYLKKPKTDPPKPSQLTKLENSLLALKIFGGITDTKIPLEIPDDDTRLAELELIFNREHELTATNLEREAAELCARYTKELNQHKIRTLSEQLAAMDEDDENYLPLLRQIQELQTTEQ